MITFTTGGSAASLDFDLRTTVKKKGKDATPTLASNQPEIAKPPRQVKSKRGQRQVKFEIKTFTVREAVSVVITARQKLKRGLPARVQEATLVVSLAQ